MICPVSTEDYIAICTCAVTDTWRLYPVAEVAEDGFALRIRLKSGRVLPITKRRRGFAGQFRVLRSVLTREPKAVLFRPFKGRDALRDAVAKLKRAA